MLTKAEAHHLEMLALHYQEAVHQHRQADEDEQDDTQHEVHMTLGMLIGALRVYATGTKKPERVSILLHVIHEIQEMPTEAHTRAHAQILGGIQALTERPT